MLEDISPVSISSYLFSSLLNKGSLWHSRLGHPHLEP